MAWFCASPSHQPLSSSATVLSSPTSADTRSSEGRAMSEGVERCSATKSRTARSRTSAPLPSRRRTVTGMAVSACTSCSGTE